MKLALVFALLIAAACAASPDVADAAMKGNKAEVRRLVQQKADVNAPQVDGTTALHWAVQSNDLEMVDVLLRAGAKPSTANKAGAPPMLIATESGNTAIIERLLAAGADPDAGLTEFGDTALMM